MNEHIELSMSVRVVRDDPRQSSSRPRNREKLPKNLRRALVFQKMPCFFVAATLSPDPLEIKIRKIENPKI